MNKSGSLNFELIQDIIKTIDFDYDASKEKELEYLEEIWKTAAGEKLSGVSRIESISKERTVTVSCADSITANELYLEKVKLLNKMREKAEKSGIKIEDIKFNYKTWKERNYE